MGCSTHLIIGRLGDTFGEQMDTGRLWMNDLAEFNLDKTYESKLDEFIKRKDGKKCFIYMHDGNTEFYEDGYGEEMMAWPASKILSVMAEDVARGPQYYGDDDLYFATFSFIRALNNIHNGDLSVAVYHS